MKIPIRFFFRLNLVRLTICGRNVTHGMEKKIFFFQKKCKENNAEENRFFMKKTKNVVSMKKK